MKCSYDAGFGSDHVHTYTCELIKNSLVHGVERRI